MIASASSRARNRVAFVRAAGAIVLLAAWFCGVAAAQSGRKIPPRRTEPPPPAATPAPAPPAEAPPPVDTAPKTRISVAKWISSINIPSSAVADVVASCVQTLENSGRCSVTSGKDLSRKEVTDAAKQSTETYFLWLQFSLDSADEDRGIVGPNSNTTLIATYYLYTPGTGKIQTQGRLYFSLYRTTYGSNRTPVPYPGGNRSTAYTPVEAGDKAAQYVLDSLAGRSSGTPTVHF